MENVNKTELVLRNAALKRELRDLKIKMANKKPKRKIKFRYF